MYSFVIFPFSAGFLAEFATKMSEVIELFLLLSTWLLDGIARVGIFVEILKISRACQLRHPGRLNFLSFNHVPVNTFEPLMLLHVLGRVHHAAQSLG